LGEDFGWNRIDDATVMQRTRPSGSGVSSALTPMESTLGPAVTLAQRQTFRDGAMGIGSEHSTTPAVADFIHQRQTLWEGTVMLSEASADARHRLVIAEYEEYLVDDDRPYDRTPTTKARRLVFVEHVEIG
jgi:hypothetical protein